MKDQNRAMYETGIRGRKVRNAKENGVCINEAPPSFVRSFFFFSRRALRVRFLRSFKVLKRGHSSQHVNPKH
jgi:hypothetical protein